MTNKSNCCGAEVDKCTWCGKTYEDHMDKPLPNVTPKVPCLLLKSGFWVKHRLTNTLYTSNNGLYQNREGLLDKVSIPVPSQSTKSEEIKPEVTIDEEIKPEPTIDEEMKKEFYRKFCYCVDLDTQSYLLYSDVLTHPENLWNWITTTYRPKVIDEVIPYGLKITSYGYDDDNHPTIDRVDVDKYAIRFMGDRFTKRGDWIYEPKPSSRTKQFFSRTQMSLQEAFASYPKALQALKLEVKKEK